MGVGYKDPNPQNVFWEGFTQGNELTNNFVWDFNDLLIHAAVSYPGNWHDPRVMDSLGLYRLRLESHTPIRYVVLADSAFPRAVDWIRGKIVQARKSNERGRRCRVPKCASMETVDKLQEQAMPSARQSSEWDIRSLKGPCRRYLE